MVFLIFLVALVFLLCGALLLFDNEPTGIILIIGAVLFCCLGLEESTEEISKKSQRATHTQETVLDSSSVKKVTIADALGDDFELYDPLYARAT
jgi:positive regulator of sigma E activity